jgi:hypothetical protein
LQALQYWNVASVKKIEGGKERESTQDIVNGAEENENVEAMIDRLDVKVESCLWEIEGKNISCDDEPYMNLVQWLVVDEAGAGLSGAKVTIGTGGGDSSVVVAHLTTDKNGLATIRLPWAS